MMKSAGMFMPSPLWIVVAVGVLLPGSAQAQMMGGMMGMAENCPMAMGAGQTQPWRCFGSIKNGPLQSSVL